MLDKTMQNHDYAWPRPWHTALEAFRITRDSRPDITRRWFACVGLAQDDILRQPWIRWTGERTPMTEAETLHMKLTKIRARLMVSYSVIKRG